MLCSLRETVRVRIALSYTCLYIASYVCVFILLATPTPTPTPTGPPGVYLEFIGLNVTEGVTLQFVPVQDDGATTPILIDTGFPFGNSIQSTAYVSFTELS